MEALEALDKRTKCLLERLRRLQVKQCLHHINQQLGAWTSTLIELSPEEQQLSACTITPIEPLPTPEEQQQPQQPSEQPSQQEPQAPAPAAPPAAPSPPHQQQQPQQPQQPPQPKQKPKQPTPSSSNKDTVGFFMSNIKHLEDAYDSDATESSSGGESCDELDQFSHEYIPPRIPPSQHRQLNVHQSINTNLHKRAIWKWATERCRLASKWTWLQAQVADLEFKIRQHSALHHQIKTSKGPTLSSNPNEDSCSRTTPINANFKKRRLIKSSSILNEAQRKLVKYAFVPCVCSSLPPTVAPCLSCNGRYNYMRPLEQDMPLYERVARLDPCCHPVLSFPDDVTLGSQMSYLLKQETVNKPMKNRPGRKKSTSIDSTPTSSKTLQNQHHHLSKTLKRSQILSSTKLRRKYETSNKRKHSNSTDDANWTKRSKRDRRASSISESSLCGSPSSPHSESSNHHSHSHNNHHHHNSAQHINRRRRSEQHAYDIDNIVIPFSIAATTRVEILEYKEIMTPSWRVWENGNLSADGVEEEEIEDLTDEAYAARHTKCELDEKKRFSLKPPAELCKIETKPK